MRRKVPFMGEEHISRAGDQEAEAKKSRGRLIDDVISTHMQPSSWDDEVRYDDTLPLPTPPTAAKAMRPHMPPSKPVRATVPISGGPTFPSGPTLKKAIIEANSGGPTIDWIPINNGHGLRINICGNLDHNIRGEWRRLMDEAVSNDIGQFEFNLTQAPSLSLTGLGMLLMFKEQKGSARGDIKLCHCNKEVWQILQWTGMDKYFTIQGMPTD